MIGKVSRLAVLFVILMLLQVLLFNNIQFSGYVNPYVYLMFILVLPFGLPAWALLLISFFTGFIVDAFSITPGMHTFASVLAGYVRPYILRVTAPRDGYDSDAQPSIAVYGARWFLYYTSVMVLIHHIALFYIEVFRFDDFFRTLLRVIISSFFSIIFIFLFEFYRKRK